MSKQEFTSISTVKAVCIILVILAVLWDYVYSNLQINQYGFLFEIGRLIHLVVWYFTFYGLIPVMLIEILVKRSRFFSLGNIICYLSMIAFNYQILYQTSRECLSFMQELTSFLH